jgi:flagellar basal body-associated protein FliL
MLLLTVVGVGVYLINLADTEITVWEDPQGVATETQLRPSDLELVSLDQITANLAPGPNGRSDNIVVEVYVGLNATGDEAQLTEFLSSFNRGLPIARSIVFDVFVTREYDAITTLEGRAETAELIRNELQEAFGSNLIVSVFFSNWNVVRGR